jgi:hypothetical protein
VVDPHELPTSVGAPPEEGSDLPMLDPDEVFEVGSDDPPFDALARDLASSVHTMEVERDLDAVVEALETATSFELDAVHLNQLANMWAHRGELWKAIGLVEIALARAPGHPIYAANLERLRSLAAREWGMRRRPSSVTPIGFRGAGRRPPPY